MQPAKYLLCTTLLSLLAACANQPDGSGPLLIQAQGSFAAGGTMTD